MADNTPDEEPVDPLDAAIDAASEAVAEESAPDQEGQAEAKEPAGEETVPEETAETEAAGDGTEGEGEAEPAPKAKALEAPQDWRVDQRIRFAKLPEDAKALALEQYKDMQAGFTRKSQDLSEKARFADALWSELQPFRGEFAMSGMNGQTAVRFLLTAYQNYKSNPVDYLKKVAQGAGIDLSALVATESAEQDYMDPAVARLERRLSERERADQAAANQAYHATYNRFLSHVQNFAMETDEAGSLKHPHMEKVANFVLAFVSNGMNLGDAYDAAVRSDPTLYGEAVKAAEDRARKAADSERTSAVEKARLAGRHKVGGAPPAKGRAEQSDLDAIIDRAMNVAGVG